LPISLFVTGILGFVNEVYNQVNLDALIEKSIDTVTIPPELGALAFESVLFLITSIWINAYGLFIANRYEELVELSSS
jgi:hypothetical protein